MRFYVASVDRQLLVSLFRFTGLLRNQKFLTNLQFTRVVDVIERDQFVVRNFQLLGDRHRVVAFNHYVSFSRISGRVRFFWRFRMLGFVFVLRQRLRR